MIHTREEVKEYMDKVYANAKEKYNVNITLTAMELYRVSDGVVVDTISLRDQSGAGVKDALIHLVYGNGLSRDVFGVATSIDTDDFIFF